MTYRQLGRFKLDYQLIKANPMRVARIFSYMQCIPIRAEMMFDSMAIEYTAIAECFKEVPEGQKIPEYELRFTEDDGILTEVKAISVGQGRQLLIDED